MNLLTKAIQRELDLFYQAVSDSDQPLHKVSKSAFTQARRKLKHTAFIELSDLVVEDFYKEAPHQKYWKNQRVVACDGGYMVLPGSKEIEAEFGAHRCKEKGRVANMACISQMYDVLIHLTLNACIAHNRTGEQELFRNEHLPMLKEGYICLLDRAYGSYQLMAEIKNQKAEFCIRIKKSWLAAQMMKAEKRKDCILEVTLDQKEKGELQSKGNFISSFQVRIIRIELPNGEEQYLATSLTDKKKYPYKDIQELYFLRWGVEESYKKFKQYLQLENFTGKTPLSIRQDFYAKIFMMNLTATLIHPLQERLNKEGKRKKYRHRINWTNAFSKMKNVPILLWIKGKVTATVENLKSLFIRCTEPVKPGRTFKRVKIPKRRHFVNTKSI